MAPWSQLVMEWLAQRSAATRRAYLSDLRAVAKSIGAADARSLAVHFLAGGDEQAHALATLHRLQLEEAGRAPSTIARHLATLRSLVAFARDAGAIGWTLRARAPRAESYRDTAGPSRETVAAILEAAAGHPHPFVAARDVALLGCLYFMGLRRGEALGCDVAHIDVARARLSIRAKGRGQRAPVPIPAALLTDLGGMLAIHPAGTGRGVRAPLFVSVSRASRGHRLTGMSASNILTRACRAAGVERFTPHALRHAAITHALDATGGDYRKVRAFSRHARLETIAIYDDNRSLGASEVSELLTL